MVMILVWDLIDNVSVGGDTRSVSAKVEKIVE